MKKLSIVTDIGINTVLFYCLPLSIISAYPKYRNWIFSNYVELAGGNSQYEGDVNKYHYYLDSYTFCDVYNSHDPILIQNGISSEVLINSDIHELIRYFIDNNKYILLFVNEYYLPECRMGGVHHFLHEQLIYGYCEANQIYYAVGIDKKGHYTLLEHSFSDIETSYEKGYGCNTHGNINWAKENRLISLEAPDNLYDYPLDKKYYAEKILNYLSGKLDAKRDYFLSAKIKRYFYGLSYYDIIVDEFDEDALFMHINHLRDHKYMLRNSLQVYANYENNKEAFVLAEEFNQVFVSISTLRNNIYKNQLRSRKNKLEDLIDVIPPIKAREYDLLSRYAEILLK